jgi:hypothetical protein
VAGTFVAVIDFSRPSLPNKILFLLILLSFAGGYIRLLVHSR